MKKLFQLIKHEIHADKKHYIYKSKWQRLHIDPPLLTLIGALIAFGLLILFSASNGNETMLFRQLTRMGIAFGFLFILAQITPQRYERWAPGIYSAALLLLVAVLIIGRISKGAQRWLTLGFVHFQPSEMMKIAVPLMLAWYFSHKNIPVKWKHLVGASLLIVIPVILTAKQPDLGTALIIMMTGCAVILFAGISWRLVLGLAVAGGASLPFLWRIMHDYQKERVMTFLNPESDPLGNGYHIIQSKIAIGSGGLFGKGLLHGTQSHLHFLPEHATDFIFAVCGEEFGLVGGLALLSLYAMIVGRCLYIATKAQDTFSRLLAGSLGLSFFVAVFVNIGMVTGLLPVVGLPLPLVSYGGTSMVTLMAGFGIIMSIHSHRTLLSD